MWRRERVAGRWTKVPYQPTGVRASSTKPDRWTTFDTALMAVGGFDGLGYVFSRDDPFTGVDLDNVRDALTGAIAPEAAAIVARLDSYTEISPSGEGLHVIVAAKKAGPRCRSGNIEMYDHSQFFCVTGDHLDGAPTTIENRQTVIDALYAQLFPARVSAPIARVTPQDGLKDADLLGRMLASKTGPKVQRLWNGDITGYATHSQADAALCAHLAFWTNRDAARMDALFRKSGLMRKKWDERRGSTTYGDRTIARAIDFTAVGYAERQAAALSLRERRWLIEHGADARTIAVLNVILLHRDDATGWCRASAETIAADAPMSRSTSLDRIRRLRRTGVIEERIEDTRSLKPPRLRRLRGMDEWSASLWLGSKQDDRK
jgi:primase-polymerase (primpol)-like protein